jgi:16S rRNA G966 N2-methylase RsmD
MDEKNKLYFGDNLKILRDYVADASVDLIYLDPPFNSQATYNVLFKEKSGEESAAQIMACEGFAVAPLYERRLSLEEQPAVIDRRYSGERPESEAVYKEIVESGGARA